MNVPKTFPEYLEKYHGTIDRRDQVGVSEDELSQHSDTEVDYSTPGVPVEVRQPGSTLRSVLAGVMLIKSNPI